MREMWIEDIQEWLRIFSHVLPVEWFTLIGSFLEEFIAPIPTALIMGTAAYLVADERPLILMWAWVSLWGAIGKTAASWLFYVWGQKLQEMLITRYGKFLGISQETLNLWTGIFSKGLRDEVIIFVTRALPVLPTLPISFASGILRVNFTTYLLWTLAGMWVRNMILLWVFTLGIKRFGEIRRALMEAEQWLAGLLIVLLLILGLLYWWREKIIRFVKLQKNNWEMRPRSDDIHKD